MRQAQELQQVLPSLVRKVEDDHLAVVYQEGAFAHINWHGHLLAALGG